MEIGDAEELGSALAVRVDEGADIRLAAVTIAVEWRDHALEALEHVEALDVCCRRIGLCPPRCGVADLFIDRLLRDGVGDDRGLQRLAVSSASSASARAEARLAFACASC